MKHASDQSAELLAALLRQDGVGAERLSREHGLEAEKAALLVLLADARVARELPALSPERVRAASERTLAQLGREPRPIIRLDRWRLALRRSPALRWVAASLLLHLMALPVLGWLAWRSPASRLVFWSVELPAAAQVEQQPLSERRFAAGLDWKSWFASNAATLEASALQEREQLLALGAPDALGPAGADSSWMERLLDARSRRIATGEDPAWLLDGSLSIGVRPLERAMWIEALLDRWVLQGKLDEALWSELDRSGLGLEQEPLVRAAWERAKRLGVLDRRQLARFERLGPVDPRELRSSDPLDSPWCALLRQELERSGLDEPALMLWARGR